MFMDEARFGRINRPVRCWAPARTRPVIGCQVVREYLYAYTAVCPQDGQTCSLILPTMQTQCFGEYLAVLSARFPDGLIVLICDGAASHVTGELLVPDNIRLLGLPPYSPELNPVEQIWKMLRTRWFHNNVIDSIGQVEMILSRALTWLATETEALKTLCHRAWAATPSN